MLGLLDLTANLEGQTEAAPSRIEVCYGDLTTIIWAEARYGPLQLGPTGQGPLHIRLTIPNLPPSPPEDADQGLPPPLKMPPLHDKQAWSRYHRAIDGAWRNQQDPNNLLTAMRTSPSPAVSSNTPTLRTISHARRQETCSMTSGMQSNNWRPSSTPGKPHKPAATYTTAGLKIAHIRADLQQSHIHRQQRIAQEHERYAQHELP